MVFSPTHFRKICASRNWIISPGLQNKKCFKPPPRFFLQIKIYCIGESNDGSERMKNRLPNYPPIFQEEKIGEKLGETNHSSKLTVNKSYPLVIPNIAIAGISPFSIGNTSAQSGSHFSASYVSLPEPECFAPFKMGGNPSIFASSLCRFCFKVMSC